MAITRPPLEPSSPVTLTEGPPPRAWSLIFDYDGSNNLIYQGFAQSLGKETEWSRDSGALVSIVVSGNVATITFSGDHGLAAGQSLIISGANVAAVNGEFVIATTPLTTTVTVAMTTPDATHNHGGLLVSTRAPRTNDFVWAIKKFDYSGSNMVRSRWAGGQSATQGFKWSERANYAYL